MMTSSPCCQFSVSDDEAREIFGEWQSPKPYIRIVPQPNGR